MAKKNSTRRRKAFVKGAKKVTKSGFKLLFQTARNVAASEKSRKKSTRKTKTIFIPIKGKKGKFRKKVVRRKVKGSNGTQSRLPAPNELAGLLD